VAHSIKIRTGIIGGISSLALLATISMTFAGSALSGDKIKTMMSDVTVEGKMNDGSSYSEFYQADGAIKGKDYTGRWTLEGDSMCFVYSSAPQKMCYQVGENASGIDWIQNGKVEGTGSVIKGNVKGY
jgi:hypothetical protein